MNRERKIPKVRILVSRRSRRIQAYTKESTVLDSQRRGLHSQNQTAGEGKKQERQIDRQTDRQTQRETERKRQRETDRQTKRQ